MKGNTREAFLHNVKSGVICPSCGSRLSLAEPGSYRAILNESTRNAASYLIEAQRHLYSFWNYLLNEHNFPTRKVSLASPLLDSDDEKRYLRTTKALRLKEDTGDADELLRSYKVYYELKDQHREPGDTFNFIREGVSQTRGSLIFSALLENSRVFRFDEATKKLPSHSKLYTGSQCTFQSSFVDEGPSEADLSILKDFLTSLNDSHVCSPIASVVFSQPKVANWRHTTAREVNARLAELESSQPSARKPPQMDAPGDGGDDLSSITGVTPERRKQLNGLGYFTFSQLASWDESNVSWIVSELNSQEGDVRKCGKSKVREWVEQAKDRTDSTEFDGLTEEGGESDRYPRYAVLTHLLHSEGLIAKKYDMLVDYIAIAEALLREHCDFFRSKRIGAGGDFVDGNDDEGTSAYNALICIVEHTLYGLAILGEHKSAKAKKFVKGLQVVDLPTQSESDKANTQDQVEPSSLYELPRSVEVSHNQLNSLVRWAPGLHLNIFNLPESIHGHFLDDSATFEDIADASGVNDEEGYFDESLAKLVDFRCQGPPATLFSLEQDGSNQESVTIFCSNECGWFPKQFQTHPILMFGSPGCGKSNVTIAGIPTMLSDSMSLGINLWPHLGIDSTQQRKMHQYFRSGRMPGPTPAEHRHVIEIKARHPEDPQKTNYYLFIDIPGELAVRGRTITHGEHELVLSTIRNAEYLCFFYDLTLDRPFRQVFTRNKEVWADANAVIERVIKTRVNTENESSDPVTNPFDYDKSRANFEQMEIFFHFLDLVRRERQDLPNDLNTEKEATHPKCIVVIPKADLFASPDIALGSTEGRHQIGDQPPSQSPFFFDQFYRFVEAEHLLEPGFDNDEQPSTLLNFACTHGPQFRGQAFDRSARLSSTKELLRKMSNMAKQSLQDVQNISMTKVEGGGYQGHSLPRLVDHINGMISGFETTFGVENVWFLPVSARGNPKSGQTDESNSDTQHGGEEYPPQKLSEFLFLLPVVESYADEGGQGHPQVNPEDTPADGPTAGEAQATEDQLSASDEQTTGDVFEDEWTASDERADQPTEGDEDRDAE